MDYYKWPAYEGNEEFWESEGIASKEKYDVLVNMYGVLPDIDENSIAEIAEYAKKVYFEETTVSDWISKMFNTLTAAAQSQKCLIPNILLAVTLLTLIVKAVKGDRRTRIRIIAGILTEAAVLLYILYQGRMPFRIIITYDLQCILTVFGFRLADPDGWGTVKRSRRILMLVLCTALLIPAVAQISSEVAAYHRKMDIYEKQISYIKKNQEKAFVIPTNTVMTAKQFKVRNNSVRLKTLGTYGWSIYSPWNEKKYRDMGLSRENQILLEPDFYLLTTRKKHATMLNDYFLSDGLIREDYKLVEKKEIDESTVLRVYQWTP